MDESTRILDIQDLTVEYTSGNTTIHAVNGVSLTLNKGEALGLVGETGAGKTTIAKSILRILPPVQSNIAGGQIQFEGEDLLQKPEAGMHDIRGKKISMIFQDPMTALNPTMTVGEQIAEALLLHNDFSRQEAEKRAKKMLNRVSIVSERYDDFPFQFSGGMKQRVVIAMALACKPDLLLADEPTTALDVTIQAQMLALIQGLRDRFGTSMILITHDLGIVAENCDKVAVVYAGQIVESGSKEDLFRHPSHPYTLGLFHSLPSWSKDSKRLQPIAGMPPDPSNLPSGCSFCPRCPYATDACRSSQIPNMEITPGHFCRCSSPRKGEK